MSVRRSNKTVVVTIIALLLATEGTAAADIPDQHCTETAKRGGTLSFVVAAGTPSFDGHRQTSHATIHLIRPFYSLLVRVDPCQPDSLESFVCDLCEGDLPEPTQGGTVYTFKIRRHVRFHDGTPLTSADIKATFDKIVFPPAGMPSARRTFFSMVESITTPDEYTVQFKLRYPSSAFIGALANPFNFVYAKRDLESRDPDWHTRYVNGTGPFALARHEPGYYIEGRRNPNYHLRGQPYLDGFQAFVQPEIVLRAQALLEGQVDIEFRAFPPPIINELSALLGDEVSVQQSDWNCVLLATPNHKTRPFDDPRVRRALTLAIDRWSGSRDLSEKTIVRSVGGIVFPGHSLAATEPELMELAGYGRDIEAARARAVRLLSDAGASGLRFELNNQSTEHPYRLVGNWLVDQWSSIGLEVSNRAQPRGPYYESLRRRRDFEVSIDSNCRSVVNPLSDISKYLGSASNNYAQYDDALLEDLYQKMQRTGDEAERYTLMRQIEHRVLDEESHTMITLWWHRSIAHRAYVKGWKISPSHYLNQHLDQVWLDK